MDHIESKSPLQSPDAHRQDSVILACDQDEKVGPDV